MKKIMSCVCIINFVILITGCSKKEEGASEAPPPLTSETWPQSWVLTIDHDATTYKYLHQVGIVINRNNVEKTYSMTELAKEKDCNWEVRTEGQKNGKTVYSFHLATDKKIRWIVGKTNTPFGEQEWYLGTHYGITPPSTSEGWLFYLHSMPKQNGNKSVAIESVEKPGWFLDNDGHTLTANGVKLKQSDDPEKATRFERH